MINMDPENPTPSPTAPACGPLTVGSPDQAKQAASHEPREELQSVATPGLLTPPVGPPEELARTVHQAIAWKNMGVLRHQVSCCGKAALEVKNEHEMTPLYHAVFSYWLEGALFLLRSGADVKNTEQAQLCFPCTPFMQHVVKFGDTELLAEVIKRGANIRLRDYKGNYYVNPSKIAGQEALFDCLAETVAGEGDKRPDLLKDLFFIIRAGAGVKESHYKIEQFITRHGGCHQAEMFQVFAACCCFGSLTDYKQALRYWRKSAEFMPHQLQSQTAEDDLARGSVFSDILDVREHPLPSRLTTRSHDLAMNIRALLALEKFMPEDDLLIRGSIILASSLPEEILSVTHIVSPHCYQGTLQPRGRKSLDRADHRLYDAD